jgi:CheY-like chemotaxis protein
MTTNNTLNTTIAVHPSPSADADWLVVVAYDDVRAGRRAMIALDDVAHELGGKRRLHPQLWRFDLLEDPDWRAAATTEAAQAGLLVISASTKAALPAAVRHWVQGWLGQSRGTAAALAVLLGPVDDPDAWDSPRVQFLSNAAAAAGLGFFAPTPHPVSPPPAEAPLATPLTKKRGRQKRSSFSASTPNVLVRQPAGMSPRTTASGAKGLRSPTFNIAQCVSAAPPSELLAEERAGETHCPTLTPAQPVHQILLVEDDSVVREASTTVLILAGYQVNAVEGSQAAWEALQSRSYDLLITDNKMPGLSGLELVRKLRSAQFALPVIMASGGIAVEELTQNQWLQPATVLPKPFTSDALLMRVAEVLLADARVSYCPEMSFPGLDESYSHWGLNE